MPCSPLGVASESGTVFLNIGLLPLSKMLYVSSRGIPFLICFVATWK